MGNTTAMFKNARLPKESGNQEINKPSASVDISPVLEQPSKTDQILAENAASDAAAMAQRIDAEILTQIVSDSALEVTKEEIKEAIQTHRETLTEQIDKLPDLVEKLADFKAELKIAADKKQEVDDVIQIPESRKELDAAVERERRRRWLLGYGRG